MKKFFVAVLMVFVFAGMAAAAPSGGFGGGKGGRGSGALGNDELRTLNNELRAELSMASPDKEKASAIYSKICKLHTQISDARFEEKIKDTRNTPNFAGRGSVGRFAGIDSATVEKINKLRDEIRVEFAKTSRDETKLRELHKKMQSLNSEARNKRFEEILKDPSKYKNTANQDFGSGSGRGRGQQCFM